MVIIVMGVTASGKTTLMHALANRLEWGELEADDLHSAANIEKMARGVPLDDADRGPWLDAIAARLADRTAHGESLVVACSALKRAYRDRLRDAAPRCLFVYLEADRDFVIDRLKKRTGHFMPVALVKSQFETLEPPEPDEPAMVVPAALPVDELVVQVVRQLAARG
jgi:gluconokinase